MFVPDELLRSCYRATGGQLLDVRPVYNRKGNVVAARLVSGEGAVTLANNSTETAWFRSLVSGAAAVCLLRGRFSLRGHRSPTQGQVAIYHGSAKGGFTEEFSKYGVVIYPTEHR